MTQISVENRGDVVDRVNVFTFQVHWCEAKAQRDGL